MSTPRFVISLTRRAATRLLVATGLLIAVGCAGQSEAIRFGDQTVSQDDFFDELDALAGPAADDAVAGPDQFPRGELEGSYDQGFATQVLTQRLGFLIFGRIFDDQGLEVTDSDRDRARGELELQPGFLELPDDYQAAFIEDVVESQMVQDTLDPASLNEAIRQLLDTTEVEINSRFGSWDSVQGQIVPPEGPLQQGAEEIADDLLIPPELPEG